MSSIIGRDKEIKELVELYNSDKSEFVAVYGRRRVGKTFLIDEALKGKITFRHAGLSPVDEEGKKNSLKDQLKHFYFSLQMQGMKKSKCPSSWMEAFFMLSQLLEAKDNRKRQVVFLDELPWMDTPRSGFITAFEGFWNTWGCHRDNLMLVVCGSANSWMLDNLVNSHGGLYGRTTYEVKLSPFKLGECEQFLKKKGIRMSRYDIVQSYMVLGGIPYYLGYMKKGLSLAQNIDLLFFEKDAKLRNEYDRLFASVFSNPEQMKRIVGFLGTRRMGYTRQEILSKVGLDDNGLSSKMLKALVASDFIQPYVPFGMSKHNEHYKLTDPFCLFYQKFVEGCTEIDPKFWIHNVTSQSVSSWRGFAFEEVCLSHVRQIKQAINILDVSSSQSSWALKGDDDTEGGQIDLLINRKDNVVDMCEMKFYNEDYTVTKSYHAKLVHRENLLQELLPKRASVHHILVTTYGLKYNEHSGIFQHVITIDQLF